VDRYQNLMQSLTGDTGEVVLQFFVCFSRFEYALKRAGYLSPKKPYAEADWKSFAEKLETSLANITDIQFVKAKTYLLKRPPQKLMRNSDNSLEWGDNKQNGESETVYLLSLVRSVRNNLFHGGKYPHNSVSGQALRNRELLQHCLTILETCLSVDDKVSRYFEDLYDE